MIPIILLLHDFFEINNIKVCFSRLAAILTVFLLFLICVIFYSTTFDADFPKRRIS